MSTAQDEFNELFRDKERRTTHPEDDASPQHSSDEEHDSPHRIDDYSDDEDDDIPSYNASNNAARSRTFLPSQKSYNNTGPKGVIADAQAYKDAQRHHRISLSASRGGGYAQQQSGAEGQGVAGLSLEEKEGSEDEEDDDDEFMAQWRQSRLRELDGAGKAGNGRSTGPGRGKAYGSLTPVDGEGYLEAVDGSGTVTVVVVFIFDDMVRLSFPPAGSAVILI